MVKKLEEGILKRWYAAAKATQIPLEFYNDIQVKTVYDSSEKSKYVLGVVFNPGRSKRPQVNRNDLQCNLCRVVDEVNKNPMKNLFSDYNINDFVVTVNEFPPVEGASLLVTKKERVMYNSKNLKGLEEELSEVIGFANKFGYNIFHQTIGAGATIGGHEHWHGSNWHPLYSKQGVYGFEAADVEEVKGNKNVLHMPDFPFAHLICNEQDTERMVYFLKNLDSRLKSPLKDGSIPHCLCQGDKGILVVPTKVDVGNRIGSAHMAGHFYLHSQEDFDSSTYESCMSKLGEVLYPKEIGLKQIL